MTDDITAQTFQQEVAAFFADVEGITIDKTADGGLVLCSLKSGRLEMSPDMVQDMWLRLEPDRFAKLLYIMAARLLQRFDTLTNKQRINMLADIECYAHLAHISLEDD